MYSSVMKDSASRGGAVTNLPPLVRPRHAACRRAMDITTSPHAELQIACAPPYCRALSAPTNNIRIGRRTAICSVHVRLGQQSPDDGLFTSSDPFPRRAQIGRASSTFLISHSHSHHGDGHNMYAQTTDDVQWSGILRDVERKKSTEPSFPPCGDREISVGDLLAS